MLSIARRLLEHQEYFDVMNAPDDESIKSKLFLECDANRVQK